MNVLYNHTDFNRIGEFKFRIINVSISVIPLIFAIFYPKVGSILGYTASSSGFLMIYVVPVITYMKMKKLEITNPLLAAALQENEVDVMVPAGRVTDLQKRGTLPKNFEDAS